jgi:hypothetical protein
LKIDTKKEKKKFQQRRNPYFLETLQLHSKKNEKEKKNQPAVPVTR